MAGPTNRQRRQDAGADREGWTIGKVGASHDGEASTPRGRSSRYAGRTAQCCRARSAARIRRDVTEDIRRFPSSAQLAWVERTIGGGARVTGGRRMLGGITSSVHRLSVRLPTGVSTHVVLKRFTDPGWGDTQAIVENEAAALAAVEAMDVPAPRLLGVSPDGAETDGAPTLLMTRAAGRVWLTPDDIDAWIRQLATLLPTLHAGSADVLTRPASRPRHTHGARVGSASRRVGRRERRRHSGATSGPRPCSHTATISTSTCSGRAAA